MHISQDILTELNDKSFNPSGMNSVVGLDGFVDKIVTPVDKRHGLKENFDPIETIDSLGTRISAAAGKSANIELFPRFEKLGGNGPIMANAHVSLGLNVRYLGALGHPSIDPVFKDFASQTNAISIADPGITTALEFKDGKLMFGNTSSLEEIDYARILEVAGEGAFIDMLAKAELVSIVNWTMIPKMTSILVEIVDKIMPNLPPIDTRNFFFDLTDPAKRSSQDLLEVLKVISRYQAYAEVTLGLNYNEALQVCETLGINGGDKNEESLCSISTEIRQKLEIACVVVHPTESAACATKDGAWWTEGPFTENPKITTGAGDHFNAGFTSARLCGFSPLTSLALATCTSGYYVRTAQSPSTSQVISLLKESQQNNS
ncbi:MAG: sugar kinase [Opitutae bacterium]|nr:sugar kinase [Opitutae bacterium]|tara:strand:+ start:3239 stop:4363 length:1125 start_codon:yes stop_codon:yes gene_type:complete